MDAERAKMDAQPAQAQAEAMPSATPMNAEAQTREAQARAAQLEAQMADLQAKKTERGMIITIGDVLFDTDQARLKPDGMATVRKLADVLAQNPNRTVLVEGFTDSTGSAAHNQDLSERRAASVRQRPDRHGHRAASAWPCAATARPIRWPATTSAGNRQLNRRVEIVLSNEGVAIPPRR